MTARATTTRAEIAGIRPGEAAGCTGAPAVATPVLSGDGGGRRETFPVPPTVPPGGPPR